MEETVGTGPEALATLAKRFPQLYVAPGDDSREAYRKAATRGVAPEHADLAHFHSTDEDELRRIATPAGPIDVLFLKDRDDFVTFLRIIGHKAQLTPIAPTIGAMTFTGLADWNKVREAYAAYRSTGGADWPHEFARLAKQPGAFRTELIVISHGPYSNLSWEHTPYDEKEWLRVSREIRLHHECAHVVCRRTMPQDILPIWDEITADVTGLISATGGYSAQLAALFLGVSDRGFEGGRLIEYLNDEQAAHVDKIAAEVHASLLSIEEQARAVTPDQAFVFLLDLKRAPLISY